MKAIDMSSATEPFAAVTERDHAGKLLTSTAEMKRRSCSPSFLAQGVALRKILQKRGAI
jgi:hypothetical protein